MSGKDWIRFWTLGIIWGTSFLWIKIAVGEITPLVLVSFRTLFAALGLLLILWFSKSVKWDWQRYPTGIRGLFCTRIDQRRLALRAHLVE